MFIFRAGCDVWPISLLKLWLWLLLLTVILFVLLVSLAVALVAAYCTSSVFSYGKNMNVFHASFQERQCGLIKKASGTTVDGRNPAPVDMSKIPLIVGFYYIPGGAGFSSINSSYDSYIFFHKYLTFLQLHLRILQEMVAKSQKIQTPTDSQSWQSTTAMALFKPRFKDTGNRP